GAGRQQHKDSIGTPLFIEQIAGYIRLLERIGAKIEELGKLQRQEWLLPGRESFVGLLGKMDFPVAVAQRHQVALVAPIEEAPTRALRHLAFQKGNEVESVEINLECLVAGFV